MILLSGYLSIAINLKKPVAIGVLDSGLIVSPSTSYFVDTTSGPIDLYLPLTPSLGQEIEFYDCKSKWGTNRLKIYRVPAGQTPTSVNDIMIGDGPWSEDLTCDVDRFNFKLKHCGSSWLLI